MVTVPVTTPAVDGLNCTVNVEIPPTAIEEEGCWVIENPVPLTVTVLSTVKVASPRFRSSKS